MTLLTPDTEPGKNKAIVRKNLGERKIKILVVEDSRTQAEYLRHILKNEGYTVSLATNGTEALQEIQKDPPGLVLTDILMPEMGGYELCRRIRGDPATASIPVILVTQLFDPVDVIRGLEAGADNFITKPFQPHHVFSRIDSVLQMLSLPDPEGRSGTGIKVSFADSNHIITAGRVQVLMFLLSAYDLAVKKNTELLETHEHLNEVNEELKRSNEELYNENTVRQQAEVALHQANKKLTLLSGLTRHDISNQLTVQMGYLEILEDSQLDSSQKEYFQEISNAARRISAMIRFTKEYEEIGVHAPTWQDWHTLVDTATIQAPLGQVMVNNNLPAGTEVFADPLVVKVFYNLMDNAFRYGGKTTTIWFTALERDGNYVIVCEDDGNGVPADEKEKIFLRGFGKNTGLGLALSREILSITGITITETGEPGKGARFEILVPKDRCR
ncbi:MAG: hybrid sensor histidine kinase/response regulator [Methanomicrobiales archaeon]